MAKITPRTLSGFMELLPAPQQQLERMMDILRKTYALYGFTPLDTPVIEASEVLLAKGGGETEKQIYRFTKGDADLSLRFDLTVPLAKYVAMHYGELAFVLLAIGALVYGLIRFRGAEDARQRRLLALIAAWIIPLALTINASATRRALPVCEAEIRVMAGISTAVAGAPATAPGC